MAIERRRLSPPPIHEDMIVNGRGTVAFIRYLTDIRESMLKDYNDLTDLQKQIDNLQAELDNTQEGAGLSTDGSYIASLVSNYINGASSLFNADFLLDAQIKTVQDELDNTQLGAGLDTDGSYIQSIGSNYIDTAVSLDDADILLDTAIFDNTRDLVISVSTSTVLTAQNQLVLCDAIGGEINITLPDPASCFSNNRSFKIAVEKVDSMAKVVNVLPFASEKIVGEPKQILEDYGDVINLITDETNWYLGS